MFRVLLLLFALACVALGLLTVVRSPAWLDWRLAILAGEFGYYVALLPLAIALLAWLSRGRRQVLAFVTVLVCGAAMGLLLKPCVEAWQIGLNLRGRLEAAFGFAEMDREPFSPGALVAGSPDVVTVETKLVADGLPLDLYRPREIGYRPPPCVVMIHGGGWDSGDRTELASFNHWLASRGYFVAAISYRLAPQHRWPAQREDVLAAVAYLKANAGTLGMDANRLILVGRSAGGQIAQVLAYTANDPAICGLVALYAPSDLEFGYAHAEEDDAIRSPTLMRRFLGGPPDAAKENYASASALSFVTAAAPPTLLLHGQLDALVWHRHSERLATRLAESGVQHLLVSLPWASHAFEFNLHGPGGQLTTYAVEWFLAAVTRSGGMLPERE
jgi:acetyl esterase/lipase